MNLAAHFNRNRNNSYFGPNITTNLVTNKAHWNSDYDATCTPATIRPGVVDAVDNCGNFYKSRINPSDTGNIRFSSLWHLLDDLTLTVDSNLQYVLANGGGNTTQAEHNAVMTGSYGYVSAASTAIVSPFGCIQASNGGCDLNGDGDILDTVRIYRPSTTNTRRWGFNTSLIYAITEGHTIRAAYTLDYGLHRQTGQMALLGPDGSPYSVWAGLDDPEHRIHTADGADLRYRDRKSKAILNQASMDYQGDFFDGMVQTSLGFRLPFFERDLNQYCYQIIRSTNPYCTSQIPSAVGPDNTVTFAGSSTKYIPPDSGVFRYNRFLPHLGISTKPFGDEHQFFAAFTKELAAPRTDNLYASNGTIDSPTTAVDIYSAFDGATPETSTSYTVGYRFIGESLNASLSAWNSQVKNRLISTWDQEAQISTYHSVPGINFAGIDADASYNVTDDLSVYGSASFMNARLISDIVVGGTASAPIYAYTGGKTLAETPHWTFTGRVQYKPLPELRFGLGGKYVGKRFATDTNNISVPD
ncbi:MAG TPA: TonB-dependent receptor, partial [Rhizomicrobium sp.]